MEEAHQEILQIVDDALEGVATRPRRPELPFETARVVSALADVLNLHVSTDQRNVIIEDMRRVILAGSTGGDLRTLHRKVKNCTKCPNLTRDPRLPLWNINNPEAVFVVESMHLAKPVATFLVEHLKASGFSSKTVALTGATRCPVQEPRALQVSEVDNCSEYLVHELPLLNAKLTVTMGAVASSVLLGPVKLGQVRGTIHWLGPWPVLPTYSPAYALNQGAEEFVADLHAAFRFCRG